MTGQSLIDLHDMAREEVEELTAIRVLNEDGTTTAVDLRTIVKLILTNLKLKVISQDKFVLTKLE